MISDIMRCIINYAWSKSETFDFFYNISVLLQKEKFLVCGCIQWEFSTRWWLNRLTYRLTPLFSGVSGVATLEDKDGDESVSGGGVAGLCSRSVVPSLETLESLMLSQVNCLEEQGCDWLSLIGVLLFFPPSKPMLWLLCLAPSIWLCPLCFICLAVSARKYMY